MPLSRNALMWAFHFARVRRLRDLIINLLDDDVIGSKRSK